MEISVLASFFLQVKYFFLYWGSLKGIISNMFSFLFLKSHFSVFFHYPISG